MTHPTNPVKPVLVTGSPRSGTTWVGHMLAASPQLFYIHEPFNPDHERGFSNVVFKHHQAYINESTEKPYLKPIGRMLNGRYDLLAAILAGRSLVDIKKAWAKKQQWDHYRRRGVRILMKDPIALMSAGWMARRFDLHVVMMIRHPAAVVASLKRLNWGFDPTQWALSQPHLLQDYLSPLEGELRCLAERPADIVEQAALLWKTAYHVVLQYMQEFPDWIYLKHEDVSADPVTAYENLYSRLGLDFTPQVKARIVDHSDPSNPTQSKSKKFQIKLSSKEVISKWKDTLSALEITRIKSIVGDVAQSFYPESDWSVDNLPATHARANDNELQDS